MTIFQRVLSLIAGGAVFFLASSAVMAESINYNSDTWNFGIGTTQPQGRLHIKPKGVTGSATVIIEADSDNNNESDQPRLILQQDGGQVSGHLGFWSGSDMFRLHAAHPAVPLVLGANQTDALWITPAGNVGIGATPHAGAAFHITTQSGKDAIVKLTPNGTNVGGYFGRFQQSHNNSNGENYFTYIGQNILHVPSENADTYVVENRYVAGQVLDFSAKAIRFMFMSVPWAGGDYQIVTNPKKVLVMTPDGMVKIAGKTGIGPVTPNATLLNLQPRLWVDGLILTKEVVVTSNWADYVFEEDYPLMPLPEVKRFIKANKHLPGVPSEKEIRKTGVKLGETQATLLAKIEELTLYVLQQHEVITGQQQRLDAQQTILTSLQQAMTTQQRALEAQQQAIADLQQENRELRATLRAPSAYPSFSVYTQEKRVTALQRTSY